jgi:hypothetical protein
MASVIRYLKSRYWVAAFRRKRSSTVAHPRDEQEAGAAVADEFERVAQRKLSAQRVRATFGEFYRKHYSEELPQTSVRSYAQNWLASRAAETSPHSLHVYTIAINKFPVFLGDEHADDSLDEITRTTIVAFRDTQLAANASGTVNLTPRWSRCLPLRVVTGFLPSIPQTVKSAKHSATFERRARSTKSAPARVAETSGARLLSGLPDSARRHRDADVVQIDPES